MQVLTDRFSRSMKAYLYLIYLCPAPAVSLPELALAP